AGDWAESRSAMRWNWSAAMHPGSSWLSTSATPRPCGSTGRRASRPATAARSTSPCSADRRLKDPPLVLDSKANRPRLLGCVASPLSVFYGALGVLHKAGTTAIPTGTLSVSGSGALSNSTSVSIAAGAELDLDGGVTSSAPITSVQGSGFAGAGAIVSTSG